MKEKKPGKINGKTRPLLSDTYVDISHDEINNIVIAQWKGTLSLEQVMHGCQLVSALVKERGLQAHLSDHTDLKKLTPEVQAYLTDVWFKEVEGVGLKKLAVRLAKDIFAQATVRRVNTLEQYGQLRIEVFPSLEQAYAWLQE